MAWPYSGNWEGRSIQILPDILSSMCLGINDRLQISGLSDTVWYNPNGGSSTSPTASFFDSLSLQQLDSITDQIWLAIKRLVSKNWYLDNFTHEFVLSDISSYYTVGGDPNDLTRPAITTNLTRWTQIRDVLDQIKYRIVDKVPLPSYGTEYFSETTGAPGYPVISCSDLWDSRYTYSTPISALGPGSISVRRQYWSPGGNIRRFLVIDSINTRLDLTTLSLPIHKLQADLIPNSANRGADVLLETSLGTQVIPIGVSYPYEINPTLFSSGVNNTYTLSYIGGSAAAFTDFCGSESSTMFSISKFQILADYSPLISDQL